MGALVSKLLTHMDMLEGPLKYIHSITVVVVVVVVVIIIIIVVVVVVIVLAINRRKTSTAMRITYIPFASPSG